MSNESANSSSTGIYVRVKGAIDVTAAFFLLILCVPLLALSAVLVKLSSRGPIFYSQVRLGKNGRPFRIYKIRTMVHNCESLTGAQWSLPGDSRITPVGHVLRRTHFDELPQLFNVLRGDMSLVGPRPERPEFVPALEGAFPQYRERMVVQPGLTGLAQVQLPPDSNLDSVRRKLTCDLLYIRRMNLWLDLRILFCTGLKVLHVPMGWPRRLLHLTPYSHETFSKPMLFANSIESGSMTAETQIRDPGLFPMPD